MINADKLSTARRMRAEKRSMHAIASTLGISRSTLYRHLALDEQGDKAGPVLGAVSPGGK